MRFCDAASKLNGSSFVSQKGKGKKMFSARDLLWEQFFKRWFLGLLTYMSDLPEGVLKTRYF